MKLVKSLAVALLAFISGSAALAQMPIWVESTAEDAVGRQLAFALREGVRRSAAMTLADRPQDGMITVRLVTMDPDSPNGGNRAIYSAVWTMKTFHEQPVEMFLTTYVGVCGLQRTTSCAQSLVAVTDEQVTSLRRVVKTLIDSDPKR